MPFSTLVLTRYDYMWNHKSWSEESCNDSISTSPVDHDRTLKEEKSEEANLDSESGKNKKNNAVLV